MLKDFLHDKRVTVVGVGIDKVAKRMGKDHGWVMPKLVELRDLAAQAQTQKARTTTKKGPNYDNRFQSFWYSEVGKGGSRRGDGLCEAC